MRQFLLVQVVSLALIFGIGTFAGAAKTDIIPTSRGDLKITLIGHASLMFEYDGKIVHIDPWAKVGNYTALSKADLILLTHHHRDHLDPDALAQITKENTIVVMTQKCIEQIQDTMEAPILMANGDKRNLMGVVIEAVPSYNLVHKRDNGISFHPKGEGNGYIITFGNKRIYVAGDTENTPEMKALMEIDAAFIPMNLPYTMDSAMAADAVKAFTPRLVYPYHTRSKKGDQVAGFMELMEGYDEVEIRILK